MHEIVWSSLWQWGVAAVLFDILGKDAYADANGGAVRPEGYSTKEYYTREVSAWEEISELNFLVWGTTFFLGLFGLSEVLMPVVAFWFEHVLSNLMLVAYLRGAYLMLEVAMLEDSNEHWWKFLVWIILNWIVYDIQITVGTEAINYLKYNDEYYDEFLRPSLFYFLKWIYHTPRSEEENEYYQGGQSQSENLQIEI